MGYRNEAVKGVGWMMALRGSTRSLSFVRRLILARILTPVDFGVFGIATLVLSFFEILTETGINVFLIQEKKKSDDYLNSAWVVSIIRGLIIGLVLFLATPFVSSFFNSPNSINLLYLMAIVPIVRGFINPSSVKFQKDLLFFKEFSYRNIILFFDISVSITAALITRSPISFVYGMIVSAFVELFLSFLIKPTPRFIIEKKRFFKVIHRGKWLTLAGIFNYLYQRADDIAVGKLIDTTSLGIYQMAYTVSSFPITEIADVVSKVTFPVMSKFADDKKRLFRAYLMSTILISIVIIPFGLILYFYAREITVLLLGENWIPAIPVLKVLSVFGVVRSISGSSSALFLAVGKQEYITVVTLVSILGLFLPLFYFIRNFGVMGAAYSAISGSVVAVPFVIYFLYKVFK